MLSISSLSQSLGQTLRQGNALGVRRGVSLALVALLHVVMLYAFTHGMKLGKAVLPQTPIVLVPVATEPVMVKPQQVSTLLPSVTEPSFVEAVQPTQPSVAWTNDAPPRADESGQALLLSFPDPADSVGQPSIVPEALAVLTRVQPTYPAAAKRAGAQGSVVLSLTVNAAGQVTAVMIVRSSGSMDLDDAAVAAAQQWRFMPRTGTSVQVQLPFSFKLNSVRF